MQQDLRLSGATGLTQFVHQLIVLEKSFDSLRRRQLPEGFIQRGLRIGSDFRQKRPVRSRPAGSYVSPGFLRNEPGLKRDARNFPS